jgi:hypothetical protein
VGTAPCTAGSGSGTVLAPCKPGLPHRSSAGRRSAVFFCGRRQLMNVAVHSKLHWAPVRTVSQCKGHAQASTPIRPVPCSTGKQRFPVSTPSICGARAETAAFPRCAPSTPSITRNSRAVSKETDAPSAASSRPAAAREPHLGDAAQGMTVVDVWCPSGRVAPRQRHRCRFLSTRSTYTFTKLCGLVSSNGKANAQGGCAAPCTCSCVPHQLTFPGRRHMTQSVQTRPRVRVFIERDTHP